MLSANNKHMDRPLLPPQAGLGDIYDAEEELPATGDGILFRRASGAAAAPVPHLPAELLFAIFDFLPPADLGKCLIASR